MLDFAAKGGNSMERLGLVAICVADIALLALAFYFLPWLIYAILGAALLLCIWALLRRPSEAEYYHGVNTVDY